MNIRVDLNTPIRDGTEVVFRSPVDCSQITGLIVYYNGESKEFTFADAHGNNVGYIDHLFAENVVVKVILDISTSMAFVQNADTNAYLEGRIDRVDLKLPQELTPKQQAQAMANIGAVASVNGIAPDENGNVEVETVDPDTLAEKQDKKVRSKNLLNIMDRVDASPYQQWPVTKWKTAENIWYKGCSYDGYYQRTRVEILDITDNSITFTQKNAVFGIGFVVSLSPNTDYYFSFNGDGLAFAIVLCDSDGTATRTLSKNQFTTSESEGSAVLFVYGNEAKTYTDATVLFHLPLSKEDYLPKEPYDMGECISTSHLSVQAVS